MTVQRVPILMYHSICDSASASFEPFTVSPAAFSEQLQLIQENDFTPITVTAFATAIHNKSNALPDKPVVLTFDDGFSDFYDTAFPILKTYETTATLYMVSGLLNSTSRWLSKNDDENKTLLTASELLYLHENGIEIGAHSVSHAALDTISYDKARREIFQSKSEVEQIIGSKVLSFAYPFGFYSKSVRELVVEAGYQSACAVRYDMSSIEDDPFALARHIVSSNISPEHFLCLLNGNAPSAPLLLKRMRSTAWKIARQSIHYIQHGV